MRTIDTTGLQYLTRDLYQAIYAEIDKYNRQANFVNRGAKVLSPGDVNALVGVLNTLDALAMAVSNDNNASAGARDEAGGLLAGIVEVRKELAGAPSAMGFEANPNATYTEDAYFKS